MAAPSGNQFWKQRTKHGRDKIFSSPEVLWEAACEYFEWCDQHPWHRIDFRGKDAERVSIPIERPYTLGGLAIFLDIDSRTLRNYKTDEKYKDFFPVLTRIEEIIRTQKFEGAAVGVFNANIIARDLGLADKSEVNVNRTTKIEVRSEEDKKLIEDVLDSFNKESE